MTAIASNITVNNSTGSDTAASGCGPVTAVTGTGASLNATSTVDVSADSPDLSGLSAGDLLWVSTSSGRQYSVIASVDNTAKTITCDDSFAVTESTRTWAVGGKRATIDHVDTRPIFSDAASDWVLVLEDTGTAYSVTSTITFNGLREMRGDVSSRVNIEFNQNDHCFKFSSGNPKCFNLHMSNTNATKTASSALCKSSSGVRASFVNITLDETNNWYDGVYNTSISAGDVSFLRCDISHCVRYGCYWGNTDVFAAFSRFSNNATGLMANGISAYSCVIHDNTTQGIRHYGNPNAAMFIVNCMFYNNVVALHLEAETVYGAVVGNVFSSNTTQGINDAYIDIKDHNAFYNNATDQVNTAGDNDISCSNDPFTDASSGILTINNTDNGGALIRSHDGGLSPIGSTPVDPFAVFMNDTYESPYDLDNGLVLAARRMTTTGAMSNMLTIRPESSFQVPFEGVNVGTIAMWAELKAANTVVLTQATNSDQYYIYRYHTGSIDKWRIRWPTVGTDIDQYTAVGTGGDNNSTVFVAFVRDGSSIYFYLNGVLTETFTGLPTDNNDASSTTQNLTVGTTNVPVSDLFAWNRVVTAAELQAMYSVGQGNWPIPEAQLYSPVHPVNW